MKKMNALLKMECKRLFRSKAMLATVVIEMAIVLLHIKKEVLPFAFVNDSSKMIYPLSVFEKWIGGENSSVYPMLYFMLMPLLMAIPYGGTMQQDIQSGYIKNIFMRVHKRKYFCVKWIVSFLSGCIAVVPLILNFAIIALILPSVVPQASFGAYTINATSLFGEMFYQHPYLYLLFWIVMDIVFCGLLATISFTITVLSEHVYVAVLAPFLVCMTMYGLTLVTNYDAIAPIYFLSPAQPSPANLYIIIVEMLVLAVIGGGCYVLASKKEFL